MNGGSSQLISITVDSCEKRVRLTAEEIGISSSVVTLLSAPYALTPLLLEEAIDTRYCEYGNRPDTSVELERALI